MVSHSCFLLKAQRSPMAFAALEAQLRAEPRACSLTVVAGFIGSDLLQKLLQQNQRVVGVNNFTTGFRHNLEAVRQSFRPEQCLA